MQGNRFAQKTMAELVTGLEEREAHYDKATSLRTEAQEEVSYFAQKYRKARSDKMKARYLEDWHCEQSMLDIINDAMPERYKMKLEDRSYREGASRKGQALQEI